MREVKISIYIKNVFIALLLLSVAIANPILPSQALCQEPTSSELRSLLSEDTHESFGMARYHHIQFRNDIRHFQNVSRTTVPGESTACKRNQDSSHINTASNCPWRYVLNHDPNRRPETIIEAKCNCRRGPCIDEVENSRCEPVKYNIRILRKYGCENGKYQYKLTMERITVGCTCVIGY
ncbi:interleukin-17F-like [Mercenaria mercenaria]|uniref:interleukin-17F-like n=1 Tax=Mercenaria mercenaria TaxID=6596 RepID=UPI00234E94B9|nr:interleukin-17F-like [Mercenaria mercenaria]